jgi:glycosyltransferase involved in cell wall biosynthesis
MDKSPQLLVIASYPPRGEKHSKAIVGGAMYAKNTLQALMSAASKQNVNPQITVLAEAFNGKKETYTEDNLRVKRFWKRNSISTYFSLLKAIVTQHTHTNTIVIEFEFAMFGDRLALLPLPVFLFILRLMRKRVIFVFHQVVGHIGEMGEHMNLKESGMKTNLLNRILKLFYALLVNLSSEVIVFEEILKKRLGSGKKITVIPFGTERFSDIPSQAEARQKLNLPHDTFILFTFGFIAWYKGSDWLVNEIAKDQRLRTKDHITLILGGGGNPNHMNKPYYNNYVRNVREKAEANGIIVTDFIPEADLPYYFAASDLVILPYRALMSSSGPLSLAFSFRKPFLLSKPLTPLFLSEDLREALRTSGLTENEIIFPLDDTFPEKLQALQKDPTLLKKVAELSTRIGEKRNWNEIGKMYYDAFFK